MKTQRLLHFLRNPWVQAAINCTMATVAYIGNLFVQGFCQPVLWATVFLVVAFLPVIFWPLLRLVAPRLHPLWQFFRGLAFCICLYCLIFLGALNFYMPFMVVLGIGIPALPLYYFTTQLTYQFFARTANWVLRGMFLAAFVPMLIMGYYFGIEHRVAAHIAIDLMHDPKPYDGPHAAAVERVIGMHFKYHTRPEIYDGWRPPMHDPALVFGLWTTGMDDPLPITLEQRVALYHQVFPERPVKMDCACANSFDGNQYHREMPLIQTSLEKKGLWE